MVSYWRGIPVVSLKYHVAWYGLSKVARQGYHRGPDGPAVLISCGGEYNAHAADTIPPTPAETLVLVMMIILAPVFVFSQILKA